MADLIGAIRLPEGSFRADAGTDVVVDILFFRKRHYNEVAGDDAWLNLAEVRPRTQDEGAIRVNRWFADHPDVVLGEHALVSGPHGETYSCVPRAGTDIDRTLSAAVLSLPESVYEGVPEKISPDFESVATEPVSVGTAAEGALIREGTYFVGKNTALMQMVNGEAVAVSVKKGRGADGVFAKHARIIRKLIPIRDAVREVLKLQERDQPWKQAQVQLRIAW